MMKLAALACLAVFAAAYTRTAQDGQIMNWGSKCVTEQGSRTCTLPSHTSYDHAFTLAASLPKCTSSALPYADSKGCYDEDLCMFCFDHVAEYYKIEQAMNLEIPTCNENHNMICPAKADLTQWTDTHLLHKIHTFWGARAVQLPREFA